MASWRATIGPACPRSWGWAKSSRDGCGIQARGRFALATGRRPECSPLFASLRRVAKRAALELVWTSESPSLEGRLRAYDVLREEEEITKKLDRLLDVGTLPWFLQRPGGTGGFLPDDQRAELAERMQALAPSLPDEVNAFVEALEGMEGDALLHDRL